MTESFPRQKAATRNFQLGAPRSFALTDDAQFVTFLRSSHGRDAVNSLWVLDLATMTEREAVNPRTLLEDSDNIPAAERARRERMRETTSGITSYSANSNGTQLAFALAGQLFTYNVVTDTLNECEVTGPIIDPRMSPDGTKVAWSTGRHVHVCGIDGRDERVLTQEEQPHVSWGLADFIAAEELDRMHGLWWSPMSDELIVERIDESDVNVWWLSDAATPAVEPREHRYPAAGTTNADISLHRFSLTGESQEIEWDHSTYEYLVSVHWHEGHDALITLSTRDQKEFRICSLSGTELLTVKSISDNKFLDVIPGQPQWFNNQLVTVEDLSEIDTRAIVIGDKVVSPVGLQVMSLISVHDDHVIAVTTDNATDRDVTRINFDGSITKLTENSCASSSTPVANGDNTFQIVVSSALHDLSRRYDLESNGTIVHSFATHAEASPVVPNVTYLKTGPHNVNTAVLFPTGHVMGSKKLPVLMRPYAGPHGAQVLNHALIYVEDQWFADQGYIVVIADGRGTPGRGPIWDRSIYHDFVQPVIDDQVSALQHVAAQFPDDVDDTRVGITGWSFGGYLAALAVMERPDVFHVGVAGAPVTEWKWYDTAYTERYLGNPNEVPEVYAANSLLTRAADLTRPLMLVHGLADDNVVSAHTLGLSGELLAHRKPHTVLPLSGVTHMTPQEVVAENLMLLTLDFFESNL